MKTIMQTVFLFMGKFYDYIFLGENSIQLDSETACTNELTKDRTKNSGFSWHDPEKP